MRGFAPAPFPQHSVHPATCILHVRQQGTDSQSLHVLADIRYSFYFKLLQCV